MQAPKETWQTRSSQSSQESEVTAAENRCGSPSRGKEARSLGMPAALSGLRSQNSELVPDDQAEREGGVREAVDPK